MFGHKFNWSSLFEFLAFASAVVIFLQIVYFAENLHRQQRLTLVAVTLVTWVIGGTLIVVLRNRVTFLVPLSYMVLAIHMLPQVSLTTEEKNLRSNDLSSTLFVSDLIELIVTNDKSDFKILDYGFGFE